MTKPLIVFLFALISGFSLAQDAPAPPPADSAPQQNPADSTVQQNPPVEDMDQRPVFRVTVYARTTKAVNYRHRGGSTIVGLRGTDLMPEVGGHAKVDGRVGRPAISPELTHLQPPTKFGRQFLTHLLSPIPPTDPPHHPPSFLPNTHRHCQIT